MSQRKPGWARLVPIDRESLCQALVESGRSLSDIARRSDMRQQTLFRLQKGQTTRIRQNERSALAKTLGVSVSTLSGDPPDYSPPFHALRRLDAWYGLLRDYRSDNSAAPAVEDRLAFARGISIAMAAIQDSRDVSSFSLHHRTLLSAYAGVLLSTSATLESRKLDTLTRITRLELSRTMAEVVSLVNKLSVSQESSAKGTLNRVKSLKKQIGELKTAVESLVKNGL
jgi:hypothetical protein